MLRKNAHRSSLQNISGTKPGTPSAVLVLSTSRFPPCPTHIPTVSHPLTLQATQNRVIPSVWQTLEVSMCECMSLVTLFVAALY